MTDKITIAQALEKLDRISEEWVKSDLEKGIVLPFRYWRQGRLKEYWFRMLWKSVVVPLLFTMVVFTCVKMGEWKFFAVLLPCYIVYWVIAILIQKREDASFILKPEGITITTAKDRIFVPWESVQSITSNEEERKPANGYNLVIQAHEKQYTFYELYPRTQVTDTDGQINLAMMPLHIAYKVLNAALRKVKNN